MNIWNAMIPQIFPLPCAIAEIFAQANLSGKITLADRYGIMAALLEDKLDDEDRQAIDRLLHSVRRGRLRIVNEISAIAYY